MQRPQSKFVRERPFGFSEARYRCVAYMPYTYSHVASLIPVERPGLGTLSVDEHMRVYYDPQVFATRSIDECTGIILHEDLHLLLRHFERAQEIVGSNPSEDDWRRFNLAADLVVNQVIQHAKVPIGQDWPLPARFGFPQNLPVAQYYELLTQAAQQPQPQQSPTSPQSPPGGQGGDQGETNGPQDQAAPEGQGGPPGSPYEGDQQPQPGRGSGGSCADGQPRPWECPPPESSEVPGVDEFNREMLERDVASKIDEAQKSRGNLPGYLTRFASGKLRPRVDPWKAIRAAVRYASQHEPGRGDYTWRRLPRRFPPGGLRLPATIKPIPRATVIVDTSGSMGQKDLAKALGVVQQGLRNVPAAGLRVLAGDTSVRTAQHVFRADQVTLTGGGGTNMGRLISDAADERPVPNAIIVITDGYTPWPSRPLGPHVIACLTEKGRAENVPKWITALLMEDEK